MASVNEVKAQALRELGVLQVGQDADAQDDAEMEDAYNAVYEILKEEGLAVWASDGTIPNKIRDQVVALMAMSRTTIYPVSDKRYARIQAKAAAAIPSIKSLVNPPSATQDDPVDY